MRSNTVFVLSLCLFGEAIQYSALNMLISSTTAEAFDLLRLFLTIYLILGTLALIYWLVNKPNYSRLDQRPLGITLMMVQNAIVGLGLFVEGLVWLFLPIAGIIGVVLAGVGVGFFKLAKGLADGEFWALETMFILTVIGIITGIVIGLYFSQIGFGIPLLSLFQLWYLRRQNVSTFFHLDPIERSTTRLQELGQKVARLQETI